MSLVVCANDSDKNLNRNSQFNAPFKWINSLKQTMRIPRNSEVAVQSVKVNKNNDVPINRNSVWFQYFGKDLLSVEKNSRTQLQEPILCHPTLDSGGSSQNVSVERFAELFQEGMNRGMPHPDAYGNLICVPEYDSTKDPTFQGFKLTSVFQGDQSATNIISDTTFNSHSNNNVGNGWVSPFNVDSVLTYTAYSHPTAPIITGGAPTTREWEVSCLVNKRAPLSKNHGIFIVDLNGLQIDSTDRTSGYDSRWQVGLVRGLNGVMSEYGMTDYYNAGLTTGFNDGSAKPTNPYPSFEDNYYDFVVSCDQLTDGGHNRLKIHQMQPDGEGGTCLEEVIYFGAFNPLVGFTANRYNMSSNALGYSKLKLEVINEQIIVSLGRGGDGNTYDIVSAFDHHKAHASSNNTNYPAGLNQSQWLLYPKVCVLGGSGKSLSIEQYGGVIPTNTAYTFDYGNVKNDWYNRNIFSNSSLGRLNDLSPALVLSSHNTYEPLGGGTDDNFSTNVIQFIVSPSIHYYTGTEQANMSQLLGFPNRSVLTPTRGGTQLLNEREYSYTSEGRPNFSSMVKSLFVRLDNFTQDSMNARVGRPSKILYHMPRFDSSNRDIGVGLYYEPQERCYVPLNNSDELRVNELNISIADEDETLALDLVGRSIVVLHFRQRK